MTSQMNNEQNRKHKEELTDTQKETCMHEKNNASLTMKISAEDAHEQANTESAELDYI